MNGRFTVDGAHPALPGHFPGRPVVPGVVLLEEILAIVAPGGVAALPMVRFLRPVLPGETVEVRGEVAGSGGRFEASVAGQPAVRGTLVLP